MSNKKMLSLVKSMKIRTSQIRDVWRLLDDTGDGKLSFIEFSKGIQKFKSGLTSKVRKMMMMMKFLFSVRIRCLH
jgi:hypothetical protein